VYNDFVRLEASLNPLLTGTDAGVLWHAILSTPTLHARDNAAIGTTTPVYLLDGTLIAVGFDDMWDAGPLDNQLRLYAPISVDQFGIPRALNDDEWTTGVWTGSRRDGTTFPTAGLQVGGTFPIFGSFTEHDLDWIERGANPLSSKSYPVYALSSEIEFLPVPEPSSFTLGAVGLALLLLAKSRKAAPRLARPPVGFEREKGTGP
jgi:hypothetical protein